MGNTNTRRKRKRNKHTIGKILAVIQIILSVVFMAVLLVMNVLPMKYVLVITALAPSPSAEAIRWSRRFPKPQRISVRI